MGISATLRQHYATTWDAAVGHRFVEEIWAGTADRRALAHYLVQDFQFCDTFLALMGAAVATCDDAEARVTHARQLGLIAGDENSYFHRAFDRLGVPVRDRSAPTRTPATTTFIELMDDARRSGEYPSILAVLLVAEWLYLDWATRPGTPRPGNPLARGWIELHSGPAFEKWVRFLRTEFDRVGESLDDDGRDRVAALFGRAVECELAFFDSVPLPARETTS